MCCAPRYAIRWNRTSCRPTCRCVAGTRQKNEKLQQTRIAVAVELGNTTQPMLLAEIETLMRLDTARYVLPFGFVAEGEAASALPEQLALARVRRGRQVGFLTDAFALRGFVLGMFELTQTGATLSCNNETEGELRFIPTSRMAGVTLADDVEIRYLSVEQSSGAVVIGGRGMRELIRRVLAGIHPEAEMGRYLTDAGFAHIAPLLGEVSRITPDGTPTVLAVIQDFIDNQGDAWQWTLNALARVIADVADTSLIGAEPLAPGDAAAPAIVSAAATDPLNHPVARPLDEFARLAKILGRRLGELHTVLARDTDDLAFASCRAGPGDTREWADSAQQQILRALDALSALRVASNAVRRHVHSPHVHEMDGLLVE